MSSPDSAPTQRIVRLVGVYDADSTLRGELAYRVGARLGRRHCSLCDITHGSVRERPEWKACQAELPAPFDTFHRNDQPDPVRAAANGLAPVVVAEREQGFASAYRFWAKVENDGDPVRWVHRVIATVVLGASALVLVGAELFVPHQ